jgi:hypothetical protein
MEHVTWTEGIPRLGRLAGWVKSVAARRQGPAEHEPMLRLIDFDKMQIKIILITFLNYSSLRHFD